MMNRLRQLISIGNLRAKRAPRRGQIAILLLLAIVAILVFALATANLGMAAKTATKLANVADTSALMLGSQLATKANMLQHALEGVKKCQWTGWAPSAAAIVAAVIATALGAPQIGVILAAAAAAALTQGLMTGTFEGALRGAIQGAIIGASIAYGVGAGEGTGAGFAGPEGATVFVNLAGEVAGGFTTTVGAFAPIPAGASLLAGSTLAMPGAVAGGTLASASNIYNAVVKEQATAKAYTEIARALTGLPNYDMMREAVFFQALLNTVEDPATVQDTNDSDGNGDTTELVPQFQSWWAGHLKEVIDRVAPGVRQANALVREFVVQSLGPFARQAGEWFVPLLDRQEVECATGGCAGADGPAVGLWRDLWDQRIWNQPRDVNFWLPGPTRNALVAWYDDPCEPDCAAPPEGFDTVDVAHKNYEQLIDVATGLLGPDLLASEAELPSLEARYPDWIKLLYEPEGDSSMFHALAKSANDMDGWIAETGRVRRTLPRCRLVYTDDPYPVADLAPMDACGPVYDSAANPVHQCVWQKPSEQGWGARFSGPDAARPACRIFSSNPNDQAELNQQIGIVRNAVRNLEQHIKDTFTPTCPIGDLVSKDSASIHQASLSDNTLQYTFDITFTCHECHWVDSTCPAPCPEPEPCSGPEPCPPPPTDCSGPCQIEVCTNPQFTKSGADSWPNIGAPDLTVWSRESQPLLPINRFNSAVDDFDVTLNEVSMNSGGTFATTDVDQTDEFQPVLAALGGQVGPLRNFLDAVDRYYRARQAVLRDGGVATNGAGSIPYEWEDTQGIHKVTVQTGPFIDPEVVNKKKSVLPFGMLDRVCLVIDNHDDGNAYVRITRNDPHDQGLGGFWKWNPLAGSMTKCASASHSQESVGLYRRCP